MGDSREMFLVFLVAVAPFLGYSYAELQCQSFNDTHPGVDLGKALKCGYDHTARFSDRLSLQQSLHQLILFHRSIKNCSALTNVMGCSFFVPRCTEEIKGPYLPCRGVCHDWANDCKDLLETHSFEWTAALCDVLPEKDDPQTTKGYRGRCFTPPGYKNSGKTYTHQCTEILIPACQGIPGYTHTIWSKKSQEKHRKDVEIAVNTSYLHGNQSASLRKEFACMNRMRPCINNASAFICQDKCLKYYNAYKTPLRTKKDFCSEFPKREGESMESDICEVKHWHLAGNWHLPDDEEKPTATASSVKTDNSSVTSPTDTSAGKTDPPETKGSEEGQKGGKLSGGAIAGIVLGLLAALVIIGVLVILFRRYKKTPGKPKPVLIVDQEKEEL
ncbi:uncharacterized protein [Montipora capricornis]|uniref:uncharacterized protein n=1 Tax=Montipora capricornis TaxID=246305 RepID=UPI0035F15141